MPLFFLFRSIIDSHWLYNITNTLFEMDNLIAFKQTRQTTNRIHSVRIDYCRLEREREKVNHHSMQLIEKSEVKKTDWD